MFDDGLDDEAYQEHQKGACTVQQAVGIPGEGRDDIPIGVQDDEVDVVRYGTEDGDADGSDHDRIQCANPRLGTPGILGAVPFADEMPDDQYSGQNTEGRQKISQNGQQIEQNICDVCHEIILLWCHSEEPTEGRRRGNLRCLSFQGRYVFCHPQYGAEACDGIVKRNEFLFVLVIQSDRKGLSLGIPSDAFVCNVLPEHFFLYSEEQDEIGFLHHPVIDMASVSKTSGKHQQSDDSQGAENHAHSRVLNRYGQEIAHAEAHDGNSECAVSVCLGGGCDKEFCV